MQPIIPIAGSKNFLHLKSYGLLRSTNGRIAAAAIEAAPKTNTTLMLWKFSGILSLMAAASSILTPSKEKPDVMTNSTYQS